MAAQFKTVSRLAKGYAQGEVDEFFTRARQAYEANSGDLDAAAIHRTAFGFERGGYQYADVDSALDRLEAAFIAKERAEFLQTHSQQDWMNELAQRARSLYGRLNRPDGERFDPAARGKLAYDSDDVDELCHRLIAYFDRGEPITSAEIREARFRRRRGGDGYSEAPVDAFFTRAIEVLLGVE